MAPCPKTEAYYNTQPDVATELSKGTHRAEAPTQSTRGEMILDTKSLPKKTPGTFSVPRRTKKRLPTRLRQPLTVVPQPNAVWAVDFMSDTLYGGRRFRTLNILDEGVREGLAIEVDTSLPAERVIRVLEQVVA